MADDDWNQWLDRGRQALQRGAPEEAVPALERARELAPGDRTVRYWLGNALRASGDLVAAEEVLGTLVAEDAGDPDAAFALAFLHRERGRHDQAEAVLTQLARRVTDVSTRLKVVGFLRDSDRFEAARAVLDRVLADRPDDAGLRFRRARLGQALGDFDAALADCRRALDQDPALAGAWLSLAQLQRFDDAGHADLARMRAATATAPGAEARTALQFALGKAHDDLGEEETAWRHYRLANRGAAALQPFDVAAFNDQVAASLARPALPAADAASGPRPLFIVGMLRSGTTLLERCLGRHPGITPRGELNWLGLLARQVPDPRSLDADMRRRLAAEAWRQLRREGPDDHVYIDKNPLNWRFLDLALALFPNARVIHIRRDLRASGLSCWFQWFQHPDAAFANDRDHIVTVAAACRRLMAHWRPMLGDGLLELDYEDLAAASEPVLRRAIAFLGLAWDDRLSERDKSVETPIRTASAWQARQPVHTESVDKWRRYERFDPGWFARLAGTVGD